MARVGVVRFDAYRRSATSPARVVGSGKPPRVGFGLHPDSQKEGARP